MNNLEDIFLLDTLSYDTKNGNTLFIKSIIRNNKDVFMKLLDKNVNVNESNFSGISPLMFSCMYKNSFFSQKIIEHDGDVNLICNKGNNVLFYCVLSESIDCLNILLKSETKTKININHKNNQGCTIIDFCIQNGVSDKMVKMIIEHFHSEIEDYKCLLYHFYYSKNNFEMFKFLYSKNLNLNEQDENGNTVLHYALRDRKVEYINFIIDKDIDLEIKNNRDETPIRTTIKYGHFDLLKSLINAGAKIDIHYLCIYGNETILGDFLIDEMINISDKYHRTPLMYTIQTQDINFIKYVLAFKPDLDIIDVESKNCLHYACLFGLDEILPELITTENIDQVDKNGNTPLILAAIGKFTKCCNLLILFGAKSNIKNKQFKTAQDYNKNINLKTTSTIEKRLNMYNVNNIERYVESNLNSLFDAAANSFSDNSNSGNYERLANMLD